MVLCNIYGFEFECNKYTDKICEICQLKNMRRGLFSRIVNDIKIEKTFENGMWYHSYIPVSKKGSLVKKVLKEIEIVDNMLLAYNE